MTYPIKLGKPLLAQAPIRSLPALALAYRQHRRPTFWAFPGHSSSAKHIAPCTISGEDPKPWQRKQLNGCRKIMIFCSG